MTDKRNLTLLKLEGLLFALGSIFFIVMFYFEFISKYFLCIGLLFFCAFLFSINATLQHQKSKSMSKLNMFLSAFMFIGGLGLAVYSYAMGIITF